jgi:hypothetical protein
MIELRWLVFGSGHRVLQQRTCYLRETWNGHSAPLKEQAWTEWSDIPQYLCGFDENGERKVMDRAL